MVLKRVYRSYTTSADEAMESLKITGIATIPNIIPKSECEFLKSEIYRHLNIMSQGEFDINDRSTWPKFIEIFEPYQSMMLQNFGIGHVQPLWDIRQTPSVVNAFAKLWNTSPENLITSFEGLSVYLPIPDLPLHESWFHIDQHPSKRGFQCFQGQIPLFDVKEEDATLSILEKSHLYTDDYLDQADNLENCEYVLIEDLAYYKNRGCEETYVEAEAGSLILWDSRLVHEGAIPLRDGIDRFRMVVFVCMMPRDLTDADKLEERIDAFKSLDVTNHAAVSISRIPGKSIKNQVRIPEIPELSEQGRRLVGF
ncbi:hypothetical protein HK098_006336 [Nowakowskiella sp. JEL0407]|nr:hypothetical protein HK098_006336 [Nowakowskiella sp. JEL0407]